ncbi:MAG: hypothetical protein HFI28_02750 [Lachnospiraceae bacterium]|nr:hypothetical protein [Lachnospiraceae bacterium]
MLRNKQGKFLIVPFTSTLSFSIYTSVCVPTLEVPNVISPVDFDFFISCPEKVGSPDGLRRYLACTGIFTKLLALSNVVSSDGSMSLFKLGSS